MTKIIKAERAQITIGDMKIDCLQFPDGSYHFYVNQLNEVLGIKAGNQTGKKYLKPLLDKDPKRVNQAHIENVKSNLKTFSLELVIEAIQAYVSIGNQRCIAFAAACLSETLERRADSVFGVKRTEDERNNRFAARVDHAQHWRDKYTNWCQLDGCVSGTDYARRVMELKAVAGLPVQVSIKDYDTAQVKKMTSAENIYDAIRRKGLDHKTALTFI